MLTLPNMAQMEEHEVRQYIADLQFHYDTYGAFLERAQAELKLRTTNKRKGIFAQGSVPIITSEPKPH